MHSLFQLYYSCTHSSNSNSQLLKILLGKIKTLPPTTSFDSAVLMKDDEEASKTCIFSGQISFSNLIDGVKKDDKNHGEGSTKLIGDGVKNDDKNHEDGSGKLIEDTQHSKANQLDVEAYASLYLGRTKIQRLLFIAGNCDNVSMQLDALRLAYDEIKNGKDTKLFRLVVAMNAGRLGPDYGPNDAWSDTINHQAKKRKVQLEKELEFYRTNLIKDDIKTGYQRLGDFYYESGWFHNALYSYMRMDEYCTTSKDVIDMCMCTILCKIETGHLKRVTNLLNKALKNQDALDNLTQSRLFCAIGLSNLELRYYKQAAIKFLQVTSELGKHYTEVISPQDIATYGGLCALASFDQLELKRKVIDNIHFNRFLDLIPEMRELIHNFYKRSFDICMEYLENVKGKLLLDIHLHKHVETLYDQISNKAALSSNNVDLSAPELEKQVEDLILGLDELPKEDYVFPLSTSDVTPQ